MTSVRCASAGLWLACAGLLVLSGCGSDSRPPSGTDGGGIDGGGGGGDAGPSGCPGALASCSGTCVDTRYDPAHCGSW